MKNLVLRKKSVARNIDWLLLSSPFCFFSLLLLFQICFAGGVYLSSLSSELSAVIQSAVWVCFIPPIYIAVLGGQFLNKIVLSDDALYVGPFSSEKMALSSLEEVGGESGSLLNGFREGITLKFEGGREETLYLDEYEESDLREFLTRLKKLKPDCLFSYSDVIPLESRGLIKFIYQSSDSSNLIVKQTKTPLEDSIFQLVREHKKAFFTLYLSGWMAVVLLFSGLSLAFNREMSDVEVLSSVGNKTIARVQSEFPDSFKNEAGKKLKWDRWGNIDKSAYEVDFKDFGSVKWFQTALVKVIVFLVASAIFFSSFGFQSLIFIWLLISFVLLFVIPIVRKLSPNFLFVDSTSIGQGMQFFPFEEVHDVALEKLGEFADPMDGELVIRSQTERFSIKLDRIPDQNTRMKVLRMVERYGVNARFNEEFLRTTAVSSDLQFTDLWLMQKGGMPEEAESGDQSSLSQGEENSESVIGDGKYRTKSVLGYGGQGITYLAERQNAGDEDCDQVVVKELVLPSHADVRIIQDARLRFEHASSLLSKIKHPSIVRHLDHFVEGSRAYLVMEYIPGQTIRELVAGGEDGLQKAQVVELAGQILEILDYLHTLETPVIHCDLAPDNLILGDDGKLKLIDFDVARVDGKHAVGLVAARPAYTPPEQFRGKPVVQSDLYAFGAIMHFMLHGEDPPPFGENCGVDESLVAEEGITNLGDLIQWCCRFDSGNRPESARKIVECLSKLEDGTDDPVSKVKIGGEPKIA